MCLIRVTNYFGAKSAVFNFSTCSFTSVRFRITNYWHEQLHVCQARDSTPRLPQLHFSGAVFRGVHTTQLCLVLFGQAVSAVGMRLISHLWCRWLYFCWSSFNVSRKKQELLWHWINLTVVTGWILLWCPDLSVSKVSELQGFKSSCLKLIHSYCPKGTWILSYNVRKLSSPFVDIMKGVCSIVMDNIQIPSETGITFVAS